jgi:hypothetical protein
MRRLVPALLGGLAIVGLLSALCFVRARKLGGTAPSIAERSEVSWPLERYHRAATSFLWFEPRHEEPVSDTSAVLSSTG